MSEIIIAGNWKMNTTPGEGVKLIEEIHKQISDFGGVQVVVCAPATHLAVLKDRLAHKNIGLGAQNVHWESSGAYTGEISALSLREIGCQWVIIGHSERRTYFGETDKTVNKRLKKAVEMGLRPIVCIGESIDEREAGKTFNVLERQIELGLEGVEKIGKGGVVIAYEPIWAIGTGKTATPHQAQEAHKFIRDKLAKIFGRDKADDTVIQYGGSMNDKNAMELLECPDLDGGLVGGASLKPEKFAAIVQAAKTVHG